MTTKIDHRQLISRDNLSEINASSGVLGDASLRAIDNLLTPAFRMSASSTPNLTLNIAGIQTQNPSSLRFKQPAPILGTNGVQLVFASGTVVFPASSGGTATPTPGSGTTITITSNFYRKILISIDLSSNIILTPGTESAVASSSLLPAEPINTYSVGYVLLFNNAGIIANITNNIIVHFSTNKYLPTGNLVGTNDVQTLTFKTLSSVVISNVSSNILPLVTSTYDLGSNSQAWNQGFINNLYTSAIEAPSSTGILNIGILPQTDFLNIGTGSDVRTINLGTGSGQTFINIGGASDVVSIAGTLATTNTTQNNVTAKNLYLNVNGLVSTAQNSGIYVMEATGLLTSTAATYQSGSQRVRLTMASTGAIAIGSTLTISGFSNTVHNGTFAVVGLLASSYIEVSNPAVTTSANDVSAQTASITNPGNAAYMLVANARTAWEFSTPDNSAKNFRLFSVSGANSWELGASVANSMFIRPNADAVGGIFYPYDNGTQLGKVGNRWETYATHIDFIGGMKVGVASVKTASFSITASDFVIPVNSSGGPFSVTLPVAVLNTMFIVKDVGGAVSTNNVTVNRSASDTIDGATSYVIDSDYAAPSFVCTAAGIWSII